MAAQENAQKATKSRLPADLPGRFTAIRSVRPELSEGSNTNVIAAHFKSGNRNAVNEILETLVGLGQVSRIEVGIYTR